MIPKIIWTYWHDVNIPEVCTFFMNTWKLHCPDYQINLLNDESFKKLTNVDLSNLNIDPNFHARKSDIVGLYCVYLFGGFWMDISIILTDSLDWTLDNEFIGYGGSDNLPNNRIVLDNWFFGAIPKHEYVKYYLLEVLYCLSFKTETEYVNYVINYYKDLQLQNVLYGYLPYLVTQLCGHIVLYNGKKYNLTILDRIDPVYGPFYWLAEVTWNSFIAVQRLFVYGGKQKIIKLRKVERDLLIIINS